VRHLDVSPGELDDVCMRTTPAGDNEPSNGAAEPERPRAVKPLTIKGHPLGLRPGLDDRRLNQLIDDLEVEEATLKLESRR